jgi:hypothetical protein
MYMLDEKYRNGYRVSSLKELSIDSSFPLRYTMQELKKIIEKKIARRGLLFIL